jgi:hypothetical protein
MAITNDENLKHALYDLIDKFDSLTALAAALTGNVTGDLTGNVTGNIVGRVILNYSAPTVDGAADMTKSLFILNGATTTIDLTAFTPTAIGQVAANICSDSTNDCSVTCGAGVTFDGTNNKSIYADAGDALLLVAISLTRWFIFVNVGSVALSAV